MGGKSIIEIIQQCNNGKSEARRCGVGEWGVKGLFTIGCLHSLSDRNDL